MLSFYRVWGITEWDSHRYVTPLLLIPTREQISSRKNFLLAGTNEYLADFYSDPTYPHFGFRLWDPHRVLVSSLESKDLSAEVFRSYHASHPVLLWLSQDETLNRQ